MEIRWLRKALQNLNTELEYIAESDPRGARILAARIFQAVNQLAKQPDSGRPGRIHGTRELIVRNTHYIIPYRVRNNSVEILRVFHTSRKLPKQW